MTAADREQQREEALKIASALWAITIIEEIKKDDHECRDYAIATIIEGCAS